MGRIKLSQYKLSSRYRESYKNFVKNKPRTKKKNQPTVLTPLRSSSDNIKNTVKTNRKIDSSKENVTPTQITSTTIVDTKKTAPLTTSSTTLPTKDQHEPLNKELVTAWLYNNVDSQDLQRIMHNLRSASSQSQIYNNWKVYVLNQSLQDQVPVCNLIFIDQIPIGEKKESSHLWYLHPKENEHSRLYYPMDIDDLNANTTGVDNWLKTNDYSRPVIPFKKERAIELGHPFYYACGYDVVTQEFILSIEENGEGFVVCILSLVEAFEFASYGQKEQSMLTLEESALSKTIDFQRLYYWFRYHLGSFLEETKTCFGIQGSDNFNDSIFKQPSPSLVD